MEKLIIAGKEFNSRLFLGTGKFNSNQLMEEAILASGTEMVTVAMKRIELEDKEELFDPNYLELIVNNLLSNAFTHISNCCLILLAYVQPKKLYLLHRWLARPSEPTG